MKSDGPIIVAVLFLAAGLTLIFAYGHGTAGANAAYPMSAASVNLSIATTGPAAMGGLALLGLGSVVLAWAMLCAFVELFRRDDWEDRQIEQMERKRLRQQEKLERAERRREERHDRILEREDRLHPIYPKE